MRVKSIRIPQDIDNAIEYVSKIEKIDKTQSFRKLARIGFEYYVVSEYRKGRITLREASELLKLTLSESIDLLLEVGVKGNIRASDILESLNTFPT
jgi:predicted HTH domain antitoxin